MKLFKLHITPLLIGLVCVGSLFLTSCSEKEKDKETDQEVEIFGIREIGELETSEYTISKIVELRDPPSWYKFGDRNILISCKATVRAGVDMGLIREEDIKVKGKTLYITLPQPEIMSFDMDPRHIHTEMQDVSGFRSPFTQDEKNKILKLGEKSIRANLQRTQMLELARNNAGIFVQNFYRELGFEQVVVEFIKTNEETFKAL
ncbi:MAG: DUF4230 domain-containing protein [Bacteroidetes bacterium]|nr:MAG: DUF4230 domain-containing protein [Bacteroidota bacterium]